MCRKTGEMVIRNNLLSRNFEEVKLIKFINEIANLLEEEDFTELITDFMRIVTSNTGYFEIITKSDFYSKIYNYNFPVEEMDKARVEVRNLSTLLKSLVFKSKIGYLDSHKEDNIENSSTPTKTVEISNMITETFHINPFALSSIVYEEESPTMVLVRMIRSFIQESNSKYTMRSNLLP